MAIAYRTSASAGNSSGGNLTVDKPTGTVDNDIMVVVLYSEFSSTAWTLPAGWAWWGGTTGQVDRTGVMWMYMAWKRASSEGANYVFTHGGTAWRVGVISSFSGAITSGDPEDSTGPTGNTSVAGENDPILDSVTTSTNNDMLIGCTGNYSGFALDAGASGMSLAAELGGCGNVYLTQATAGASGNKTLNFSSGYDIWASWHVAIKEASGSATLEQEGFRWGKDDGSESAHTFEAAQDTNITLPAAQTKLLRTLINATNDPAAIAFKLKVQKNGSGGYATVPLVASSKTTPVIEAADTTSSGDNATTPTSPWAVSRPTAATGDLLIMIIGWDDSVDNAGVTVANGPNSEVWTQIGSVVASASTEVRMTAYYVKATGTWGAGTISVTPTANEQWTATVIKVLAGEFDATTPIGASNTRASAGTAETNALSPSLTAGSSDGSGKLIWAVTTDTDPLVTLQSGNTSIANNDRGNEALGVAVRDTAVTDSESIAGGQTWSLASDSWCSITFVVRAPTVTNEVYIATSSNIAAGGENTTARLTAPSGKTTSNFTTGRRWDDENGTDTIDIASGNYTELEWAVALNSGISNTTYYEFRVYNVDAVLDTYTVTPRWTVGAGGTALNQATETDLAQAIGKQKTKAVGQITETDLAQAVTPRRVRSVAQVTETDQAQAVAKQKIKTVNQALETDLAQAITITGPIIVNVLQVTETDLAQAITKQKARAVAQVTETDTAQAIAKRKTKALNQVTETDLSQAISKQKIKSVTLVTETNLSQAIAKRKIRVVLQVTETDTAQAITTSGNKIIPVTQVLETDTAQPIAKRKVRAVAQVLETDAAQPITKRKVRAVAQVVETDAVQPITKLKVRVGVQVAETDLAQALFRQKRVYVAQVIEVDAALVITVAGVPVVILGEPSGIIINWDQSFHWTGIPLATWYNLQVLNSANIEIFASWYLASSINVGGLNFAVTVPSLASLPYGLYKWNIQDWGDSYGSGVFTPNQEFTLSLGGVLNQALETDLALPVPIRIIPKKSRFFREYIQPRRRSKDKYR